ncbi:MAG TPA: CHASE2 domain-containing protein [Geothrix sp.]
MALLLTLSGALAPVELLVRDAMLRNLPSRPASNVAVVLIDEDAIRAAGRWPWDRAQLARLVDKVFAAGAKGIAIDLLFPEEREGDDLLAQALKKGPSVIATGLDETGRWLPPNQILRATATGHVSFDLDRDGVVRRFASMKQLGDKVLPAMPVAAARLADDRLPIPVGMMLRPGFQTRPISQISAAAVLESRGVDVLRGRVVFIGTSAAGVGDRFISPISQGGSPEPGVMVEAISAEAILSKDLLYLASPLINAVLALALGWLGTLMLASHGRTVPLLAPGVVLAPLLISALSLNLLHLELAPVTILVALVLIGALMGFARSRRTKVAMSDAEARISELERIQGSLSETRQQDAEARRVVAHELKTPLTSVKGLAQLLAQFDLSGPERNRVAQMVVSETSRLAEMVDALLDLERLRLRVFERDAQPLDLSGLCTVRGDLLRAGTKREILTEIQADLHVLGDKGLLERVIENLVANALKFSPDETPILIRLKADGPSARLEVEDRGPGIPIQERERIFGRFARGSTQGLAPGLGLGLALVAEVVNWHGGTVEADERAGGGSVFRIRLPLNLSRKAE